MSNRNKRGPSALNHAPGPKPSRNKITDFPCRFLLVRNAYAMLLEGDQIGMELLSDFWQDIAVRDNENNTIFLSTTLSIAQVSQYRLFSRYLKKPG
jgi:hypothetical protein